MKSLFTVAIVVWGLTSQAQSNAWAQSPYDLAKQQAKYGPLAGPEQPPPGYRGTSYNQRQGMIGPLGGARYSSNRGGAYVAPDGSTIESSSQTQAVRGPLGAAAGTRTTETKVTAASGNAYVWSGSTQSAAVGPPVSSVRGYRSTTTAVGPYGGIATRRRSVFVRP
ncbi:MAG: hypothetical protein KDA84_08170 [Planctomycetaceae bacterium]|nr:hypothetical protein [Planctomycetaceae bacterium]